jgi:hypothetical protein
MPDRTLTGEALKCRLLARELAGRLEQPFLLKMADTFTDLARSARRDDDQRQLKFDGA